jgi:hypothetical protein
MLKVFAGLLLKTHVPTSFPNQVYGIIASNPNQKGGNSSNLQKVVSTVIHSHESLLYYLIRVQVVPDNVKRDLVDPFPVPNHQHAKCLLMSGLNLTNQVSVVERNHETGLFRQLPDLFVH